MTSHNGLIIATMISPNFVNIQLQRKPQEGPPLLNPNGTIDREAREESKLVVLEKQTDLVQEEDPKGPSRNQHS
eukprot:scaffold149460_cov69-Cyclotella_meneghiniana.AAC.1